jgi:hypothetical protein
VSISLKLHLMTPLEASFYECHMFIVQATKLDSLLVEGGGEHRDCCIHSHRERERVWMS